MAKALRAALGINNIVCCVSTLALATLGVWYTVKFETLKNLRIAEKFQLVHETTNTEIVPYIFAVVGILGILVTCSGIYISFISNRSCLIIYTIFTGILIIALITCSVFTIITISGIESDKSDADKSDTDKFLTTTLGEEWSEAQRTNNFSAFSAVEIDFHCCGYKGPTDYSGKYPKSCKPYDDKTDILHMKGCTQVIKHTFSKKFSWGEIGCGVVAFLELVNMILAILLVRQMKCKDVDTSNPIRCEEPCQVII